VRFPRIRRKAQADNGDGQEDEAGDDKDCVGEEDCLQRRHARLAMLNCLRLSARLLTTGLTIGCRYQSSTKLVTKSVVVHVWFRQN
jgi:hypothetical protein